MGSLYILIDDGDITLFSSIEALERYVESPDIDRYTVFDNNGVRLHFESTSKVAGPKSKIAIVPVVPVRLKVNELGDVDSKTLLSYIRDFLTRVTGKTLGDGQLSEMITKVQDVVGILD